MPTKIEKAEPLKGTAQVFFWSNMKLTDLLFQQWKKPIPINPYCCYV